MPRKSWYHIENKASDAPTIYVYGEIGAKAITAMDFVKELNGITARQINMRMHSPGGNMLEGMTIYDAISNHPAQICCQIDGVAASIASVIAMGANTRSMAKGAMMMIHKAYVPISANADEMRKTADVLDLLDNNMAQVYSAVTKLPVNEITDMMGAETWMTADKCKALGFCDCITGQGAIKNAVDFSAFSNVPEEAKAFFNEVVVEPATERELEQILRDAGVSTSRAKAAVAAIKGDHRDDDELKSGISTLLTKVEIENLTAKFKGVTP